MTLPKDKKPKQQEIESMKIAVSESGIQAIHPDKMEDFAAHMVEQLKEETEWRLHKRHKGGFAPPFFMYY